MRPLLDDGAVRHHDDVVRLPRLRDLVRGEEDRPVACWARQGAGGGGGEEQSARREQGWQAGAGRGVRGGCVQSARGVCSGRGEAAVAVGEGVGRASKAGSRLPRGRWPPSTTPPTGLNPHWTR